MNSINSNVVRRKGHLKKILAIGIPSFLLLVALAFVVVYKLSEKLKNQDTVTSLQEKWSEFDYSGVYEVSGRILKDSPFNNVALIYRGYASFYLAVSSLDTSQVQDYLNEAIRSLRLSLYKANRKVKAQVEYMLGKAYFYKNTVSSYYYSDLALKYLTESVKHGYKADDIAEYLGLTYASLGQPMESIASFTEALLVRESDNLLLSIAEQYYKVKQYSVAKQYLFRIKKESSDDELVLKSANLLGLIYIDEENWDEAKVEFESILEKKPTADAYYGLGVVYEKKGDLVKARSQWRKALKIKVNHQPTLEKMGK